MYLGSQCVTAHASTCCVCEFPPLPLCLGCISKHQQSQLFHYFLTQDAASKINQADFGNWQDWLYTLHRAQCALMDNQTSLTLLKDKAETGNLDEPQQLIVTFCEEMERLMNEAVAESTELATTQDPEFASPLAELVWLAARRGNFSYLKFFDPCQFKPSERKSTPKKTDSVRITEAEERVREYERELMSLHQQLQESEQSLLLKQSEIEKLNNLLIAKSRKLESYTQKNRALGTQTKRAKGRLQMLLERNGLNEQLSVDDILGITEDYRPADPLEIDSFPKKEETLDNPKLPRSSYFHYYHERRAAVKAQNPSLTSNQVSSIIGEEWNRLPEDMKQRYNDLYRKDKERWKGEIRTKAATL